MCKFTKIACIIQLCIILLFCVQMLCGSDDHKRKHFDVQPKFDDFLIRSIDATAGETILLPCIVHNLGNKVVSWIRSRDLHILTSGLIVFSSDSRFESVHPETEDFWGLRIRGVLVTDTGKYECQVSTDPKMSIGVNLTVSPRHISQPPNVWVSQALIRGPKEMFIPDGDSLNLICEIIPLNDGFAFGTTQNALVPGLKVEVQWYHEAILIPPEEKKSSLATITNTIGLNNMVTSRLFISRTRWKDSGQYICMQPNGKADFVKVTILEGEHPEAMQGDFPISSFSIKSSTNFLMIFFVYILCLT